MIRRHLSGMGLVGLLLLASAPTAEATDGHFLHGVGAINAAMGGAGIAAPASLLGTFALNPAGLMAFDGTRMEFSMEAFKADRSVASSAGPFSGSTTSVSDWVPIPAFGATYKLSSERVVLGLGGLGIGGFGVDYPAEQNPPNGTNPILFPQPNGFGQVYSNYSLLKVTPSVAWEATEKLWLGAAVNIDWAQLAIIPAPVAAPDFDSGSGTAYFPQAGAADGAFGYGFQLGLLYNVNDMIALGASYASEQWFSSFEWNSTHANPNLANFGEPRTIKFKLNAPAIAGAGIGVQALPSLLLTGDFKYYFYESTPGFELQGSSPFNADGSVSGFAWQNIYSIATGLKFDASSLFALYGGYNYSQNPIPDEWSMINVPAPAVVQHHATFGVGIRPTRHLEITVGYYHVFENSGSGPIYGPSGPVPGSSVTNTMHEDSIQPQFSYVTRGQI
jgi:long-chain fatty acid transport protein